ncbi:MAG: hypothetical protein HY000_38430 [Planctomycetes bacterium]|nr:hypothetical protein [Planctomycetota bacterium]
MGRKSRLSKDQLRKVKQRRELARRGKRESLAYRGNKYRRDEYVPWIFAAETQVNELSRLTGRRLTDANVASSLEAMILGLRRGTISLSEGDSSEDAREPSLPHSSDGLSDAILRRWRRLAENEPRPSRDDLVGILRTILGSMEVWRTAGGESRGYLNYLEGFLRKLGVEYIAIDPDMIEICDLEEDEIDDEDNPQDEDTGTAEVDDLLHVGRVWYREGESWAAERFRFLADGWISVGNARHVVETCHRLISEADPSAFNRDALAAFSIIAQQAIKIRILLAIRHL